MNLKKYFYKNSPTSKKTIQALVQDNDDNWKTRGKYNSTLTYDTYQIKKEIRKMFLIIQS